MKRIIHPNSPPSNPVKDIPISDISVVNLLNDGLLVLYREIKQLLISSAKGKLSPMDAKDLRDHLKLLFELKDREKDLLKNLSDEEIKELLDKGVTPIDN